MIIKVCGMRHGDNIHQVEALGVDMIGLIFAPQSPRYVDSIPSYLPCRAKRVGVFVDESVSTIISISATYHLDYVQLHGSESPQVCMQIKEAGLNVIKAISVRNVDDINCANEYQGACDCILFDTKVAMVKGGSGTKFNWNILDNYKSETPFLLSGGISVNDTKALLSIKHNRLAGFDLNSRFEIEPGTKDIELLKSFLQNIKAS